MNNNNNNDNIISNPEKNEEKTIFMNDRDYLNCILEVEKNMSNNLSCAMNEASNNKLFDFLYNIFDVVKKNAKDSFALAFKNGWYKLEKVDAYKIDKSINDLEEKFNELNIKD